MLLLALTWSHDDLLVQSIAGNSTTNTWNFLTCPMENECLNSHHSCDLEKEDCTDLELGYKCQCKDGYELMYVIDNCVYYI